MNKKKTVNRIGTRLRPASEKTHVYSGMDKLVTVTAVLPWSISPFPRYYCVIDTRYRGNTAHFKNIVTITAVITVTLSTSHDAAKLDSCVESALAV